MQPRPYQTEAKEAIYRFFEKYPGTKEVPSPENPIVVMPTGTGKSVVIGDFVHDVLTRYPFQRIMMLTHVMELIEQNAEKLLKFWPTAPLGICSAGLGSKDTQHPIIFAGIGSVVDRAEEIGWIDLILIDECDLVSQKESGAYKKFIAALRKINPHIRIIGFTATPYRLGLGPLTDGGIFTQSCIDLTELEIYNRFFDEGYLCRLIPKRTNLEIDVSNVAIVGGEFKQNELQKATDLEEITFQAVQEALACGADRKHWLAFASGVEHCEHVAAMLESFGISCCIVHSKMPKQQRRDNIRDWKAGKYRCAVNNNVLTTGIDFPGVDLILILRATMSARLWVQMLGRGTRPLYAPGFDLGEIIGRLDAIANSQKPNCLVLDFAGNTRRLGQINNPVLPRAKGQKGPKGVAPVKECGECHTWNHASARVCCICGEEFAKPINIRAMAFSDEVIAQSLPQVEWFPVDRITYAEHRPEGRPASLKVTYYSGLRSFQEWVCFEHDGFPKHKAHDWWRERAHPDEIIPMTVKEALRVVNSLEEPRRVSVWINTKHPQVKAYEF